MTRLRLLTAIGPLICLALARCIGGDDSISSDGGGDASSDVTNDLTTTSDGGDSGEAAAPAPTPDGSIAWVQHFNTARGFEDLAVNPNGGPSFVVAGGFSADPGGDINIGSHQVPLQAAMTESVLLATLNAQGPVWAIAQQQDSTYPTDGGFCSGPTQNIDHYDAVAVDAAGNIYVAGSMNVRFLYLKDTFPGPTSFVAAFSNTGAPLWDHLYSVNGDVINGSTDTGETKATLAVVGSSLFVSFGYNGTLLYDGQLDAGAQTIASSSQDIFVAALDTTTGSTKWHTTFGSPYNDTVEQVAATPQGDVLITGTMAGTMTGPTSGSGFPVVAEGDGGVQSTVAYVVKLDGSGTPVYSYVYNADPGASTTTARGIAYGNGVVAVGGYFSGAVDFGDGKGAQTSQGDDDGFIALYDEAAKKTKWTAIVAGGGDDVVTAVGIDAWNEVFAVGTYGAIDPSSASLGNSIFPQTSEGVAGMMIGKLDATGTPLWAHAVVPTAADGGIADTTSYSEDITAFRLRVTPAGQVVVAGEMAGGADFGTGYQTVLSTTEWVQGCHLTIFGGKSTCYCTGIVTDSFIGAWQP